MDEEAAFASGAFRRFERLTQGLKERFGYLAGDANWGGVLNLGLDLRGQTLLMDLIEQPDQVQAYFQRISRVIERFVALVEAETGSSSVSVNRTVLHLPRPVFLHSECSNTMISVEHYEQLLLPLDHGLESRATAPSAFIIAEKTRTASPPLMPKSRTWISWMSAGAGTCVCSGNTCPDTFPQHPPQSRSIFRTRRPMKSVARFAAW